MQSDAVAMSLTSAAATWLDTFSQKMVAESATLNEAIATYHAAPDDEARAAAAERVDEVMRGSAALRFYRDFAAGKYTR